MNNLSGDKRGRGRPRKVGGNREEELEKLSSVVEGNSLSIEDIKKAINFINNCESLEDFYLYNEPRFIDCFGSICSINKNQIKTLDEAQYCLYQRFASKILSIIMQKYKEQ